jgi:hypothetical protein
MKLASSIGALVERGHAAAAIAVAEPGTGVRDMTGRALPFPDRDEVARILAG